MHYSINVSKDGKHYFATADRSLDNHIKAGQMIKHFKEVFPASEGYKIDVTRYETIGRILNPDDLIVEADLSITQK